ncbi:16S rRNA (cytosine1402-N4)-methyltransferase [Thiogranum longum]|uniref:Ribosomal RNA small subunit methyltransferase H n=1 Tax=Thiogranum longum TaxID=1537524 RepID=A0A4R1H6D4_9GAMM|nr:16S rRNA (cytosine(1402)-N(4))-methyltransferase RsmH [Thiogranum longum]TCK17307.1 16S rRNA (cytosine1402-N4)-methyltransferase [Thiogranum longum]
MSHQHQPVLLAQVLDALRVKPDGLYIDGTFGRGGHAAALLEKLGPEGRLLAFDKDPDALAFAASRFSGEARLLMREGSFDNLASEVSALGWQGRVDGIMLDLGVSSPQLDDAARGFSFMQAGPLDMRMNPQAGPSAAKWLAQAPEQQIADVLWKYGEERFSRRIARAIVNTRDESPITTTLQLASLIQSAAPGRERHKHPATRSFQAIRIFINRELEDLEAVLPQAVEVLAPGGRLAVISFHSLEDRIVKRFIREQHRGPQLPPDFPVIPEGYAPKLKPVGKQIRADEAEININPRARSAVLRVAERIV